MTAALLALNERTLAAPTDDPATRTAYLDAVRLKPTGPLSRTALYNALASLEVARAAEFESAKKAGKKPEETPTDKKLTEAMNIRSRRWSRKCRR